MTASIFGNRYLGIRELPWHNLGLTLPEPIPPVEAVAKAGLDYSVETFPLVSTAYGQKIEIPGKKVIVRGPTSDDPESRVFGVVGEDYEVLQNLELANMLTPLSEDWPLETMGALGFGEKVFMTLDAGNDDVQGEAVRKFLLLTDDKSGGGAIKVAFTPVRVVCTNTLTLGLAQATFTANINHTQGAKSETEFRLQLMAQAKKAEAASMDVLRQMAITSVVEEQVQQIVAAAYPYPTKPKKVALFQELNDKSLSDIELPENELEKLMKTTEVYDYYRTRIDDFRAGAITLHEKFNDEFPDVANTAWSIYNAVVECSDFRRGGKNINESVIFGDRAREKKRAFQAAAAVLV